MNSEPRQRDDYNERQVEAAHRVLVDIGQVLADFRDCLVVVGGWVPDLLLQDAAEPHIGSIDVDLALDAAKLNDGRYAEMVKLLLDTRRYRKGVKDFQLVVDVDLKNGDTPVQVEVEFLAPKEVKMKKHRPKLLDGFRVLQVEAVSEAFRDPEEIKVSGPNIRATKNTVRLRVASLADWLVMKAHAIGGRDKPKDCYDFCYGLENCGIEEVAAIWKQRAAEKNVFKAIEIMKEKFVAVDAFGPLQVVEFNSARDTETQAMHARRAYELVQKFLALL